MRYRHVVEIDSKEVEVKDLPKEVRDKMVEEGIRRMLAVLGCTNVKTA